RMALVQLAEYCVPLSSADRHRADRARRMGGAAAPSRTDTVPRRRRAIPDIICRHRNQPVADDRAVSLYAVAGRVVRKHASLSADRYAVPMPIILMYTAWSYWVFRGKVQGTVGYH